MGLRIMQLEVGAQVTEALIFADGRVEADVVVGQESAALAFFFLRG